MPQYSYDWQWIYQLAEPKDVPAGTLLQVDARWDNSAANPRNPNPNVDLAFGEGTDDEMLVGFVDFVVKDGVRPAPVPIASELRRLMGMRHASSESYLGTCRHDELRHPDAERRRRRVLPDAGEHAAHHGLPRREVGRRRPRSSTPRCSPRSADTMPLGIVVERTPEGGIQGELFFGRNVSAAERASMAGTGQRFRGERLDAGRHRLGR